MELNECWLCDSTEIVYTDSLGSHWCQEHYQEFYNAYL